MSKKKALGSTLFILFVTASILINPVFAQFEKPPGTIFGGGIPTGPTSGAGGLALIQNITNWIFIIVLLFSVIFIVLAGWQFISGGGDAQQVAQARNKLLWGVIGIIVAVVARAIPVVVESIVGG